MTRSERDPGRTERNQEAYAVPSDLGQFVVFAWQGGIARAQAATEPTPHSAHQACNLITNSEMSPENCERYSSGSLLLRRSELGRSTPQSQSSSRTLCRDERSHWSITLERTSDHPLFSINTKDFRPGCPEGSPNGHQPIAITQAEEQR